MKRPWHALLALSAAVLLTALTLASCVTSAGRTLDKTTAAERAAVRQPNPPSQDQPPVPPSTGVVITPAKGLLVVTNPTDAEVYLNDRFMGRTPLTLQDLDSGAYRLTLRKDGYYELVTWVNFSGESMRYETNLVQITGFLQVSTTPPDAIVSAGGQQVASGMNELPVGTYDILVRAFGYSDYRDRLTISERSVTAVNAELVPAAFRISEAAVARSALNPMNPGVLGSEEVRFEVTGPGSGEVSVQDADSREVFHAALPDFTTWSQRYLWTPRESPDLVLPDGDYRVVITARGAGSAGEERAEVPFRVDSTSKIAPRSVWSGSAGLLFAPTAEVLPAESLQLIFLAAGGASGSSFRAPAQIAVRIGFGGSLEIDAEAAIILTDLAVPLSAGVSARYSLLQAPHGGFSAAVEAKAAAQFNPSTGIWPTDTFTNFTGISVSLPLQLTGGPVSALADIGIIASLWQVSYQPVPYSQTPSPSSWLYVRAGLLLDFGSVTGGLSLGARTEPLGFAVPAIAFPFQAGAEVHWLIPGTHLLLSGVFIGEVDSTASYYFLGGGGLGFLF